MGLASSLFKAITFLRSGGQDEEARKRRLNEQVARNMKRLMFLDSEQGRKRRASRFVAVHSHHYPVQKLKLDFVGRNLVAHYFTSRAIKKGGKEKCD